MRKDGFDNCRDVEEIPHLKELAEFRFQLRKFLSFSEASSERHGIQVQQYQLLQVVAAAPNGHPVSVGYIAERMQLRHNSAVELVDRAERAGLVPRRIDKLDRRRTIIQLTAIAEQVLQVLVADHIQELERVGEDVIRSLQAVV